MVVHILHNGYAICEFSHAMPCDWPPDHRWVSCLEEKRHPEANCPGCIERFAAASPDQSSSSSA